MDVLTDTFRMIAVYVAINGTIMLLLGMLVVRARAKTQTLIGDGGNPAMIGAIRAHANNTEYVPLPLLMMVIVYSLGGSFIVIHAIGLPLTLGRILHAFGLSRNTGTSLLRFLGMILTWIGFIAGIVGCLWFAFVPKPV